MPKLTSEVQFLKGVGPKRAESLADKGINTVRDVLFFFPNKYKDFTKLLAITDLSDGDEAVVRGRIIKSSRGNPFGKVRYRMTISDGTGTASAIWFKTLNGLESFRIGEEVYISGKVIYRAGFTFVHPTVERTGGETRRANRISPVYPEIDGIGEASIHNMVEQALTCAEHLNEFLPQEILLAYSFPERARALKEIHSPRTSDRLRKARQRFVFEEFFLMQVATALKRHHYRSVKKQRPMKFSTHIDSRIRARFPFSFTKAQDRAIGDIVGDMTSEVPMEPTAAG
ncbi:MAG: hypothetical protein U5N86_06435 [Planctomycetota bacterium]|nr:hypothetical protein [Planctomycetota bacterium]